MNKENEGQANYSEQSDKMAEYTMMLMINRIMKSLGYKKEGEESPMLSADEISTLCNSYAQFTAAEYGRKQIQGGDAGLQAFIEQQQKDGKLKVVNR